MEDIKKEFERRFCDSYTIETLVRQACTERTVDVSHVFQFIEQKCVPKSELERFTSQEYLDAIDTAINKFLEGKFIQGHEKYLKIDLLDILIKVRRNELYQLQRENAELKGQLQQQWDKAIDECIAVCQVEMKYWDGKFTASKKNIREQYLSRFKTSEVIKCNIEKLKEVKG